MYNLNYRDNKWTLRFRILELICCGALIIVAILLIILVPSIKIFIVLPVLVFATAFFLICLYNLFGFGSEITLRVFRSWAFFSIAGMALFFLAAGLLIIPIKYALQSDILNLTAAFAILAGTIFLLDILFLLRLLYKHIIPGPTQRVIGQPLTQAPPRRQNDLQAGEPITVCPACSQPCSKRPEECLIALTPITPSPDCDHCRPRRQQGFPCDSECCGATIYTNKSTQMSYHEPSKTESYESIEEEIVKMHELEYTQDPCPSTVCREKNKINKQSYSCPEKSVTITISNQVQTEPILPKVICDINLCKRKVLQMTRSIQVGPEPDKTFKTFKSKRSAKVSPTISETPLERSNMPALEAQIITKDQGTCTDKKCLKKDESSRKFACTQAVCNKSTMKGYDEEPDDVYVVTSKKGTSVEAYNSKKPPTSLYNPVMDVDGKCTKKCGISCGTQMTSREKLIDGLIIKDDSITQSKKSAYTSTTSSNIGKNPSSATSSRIGKKPTQEKYQGDGVSILSEKKTVTPYHSAAILKNPEEAKQQTSQNLFLVHGSQIQTYDKAIQFSNIKECTNPTCIDINEETVFQKQTMTVPQHHQEIIKTMNSNESTIPQKISKTTQNTESIFPQKISKTVQSTDSTLSQKISKTIQCTQSLSRKTSKTVQTSDSLLPCFGQKPPVSQKTYASQTYDTEISTKHPYIILVKESSECPNRSQYVQVQSQQAPITSEISLKEGK